MSVVASQITSTSSVCSTFIQTNIKDSIKGLHYWPFVRRIRRWLVDPLTRASNAENVSISWHHNILRHVKWAPGTTHREIFLQNNAFENVFSEMANILFRVYHDAWLKPMKEEITFVPSSLIGWDLVQTWIENESRSGWCEKLRMARCDFYLSNMR